MISDRLSDRVKPTGENDQATAGARTDSAHDSSVTQPVIGRATEREDQRALAVLSDRDRAVIEVLANLRMATGGQLQRLFWDQSPRGQRLGRHHLAKLTRLRVLTRLGI